MRNLAFIIIALYFCIVHSLFARVEYDKLKESSIHLAKYEIDIISFKGNTAFPQETLESIIASRKTTKSFAYTLFDFAFRGTKDSPIVPTFAKREIKKQLDELESTIVYFSEESVSKDIRNLRKFYHQNGYHDIKIDFIFTRHPKKNQNILRFYLSEGKPYQLDKINLILSDSLPIETNSYINSLIYNNLDKDFNESNILQSLDISIQKLKDKGYYFSYYKLPELVIDNNTKSDSLAIKLYSGKPYRVDSIAISHKLNGQNILAREMARSQIDFEKGELYSYTKIKKTEANYLSLNLFNSISIDTISTNKEDSTLSLQVNLNYKKQQDYNFGIFTNRTTFDKYWNAGVEASYTHRNIFGAAQSFNPFVRFTLLDLSRFFETNRQELEYQAGINLSTPLLWTIDKSRVSSSAQFAFSYKRVIDNLWLSTVDLPFRFAIKLPDWTLFNNASLDLGFRRQIPTNYDEAWEESLRGAKTEKDTLNVLRKFIPFSDFNSFVNKENPLLTSTIFSFGINGDTRNDIFSPSSGYFLSFLADLAPFKVNKYTGASQFLRFQAFLSQYFSLSYQSIIAYKMKFGHILTFDKENSITPYDLQFYAGGANSIRGWASRRLRFYGTSEYKYEASSETELIEDYIGSATILEGSIEYRYKLAGVSNQSIRRVLKDVQLATFVDFGNAYNWYLLNNIEGNDDISIAKILKGIAVAAGFGIRYESPIGVIRADLGWKLYDPNSLYDPQIKVRDGLGDVKIHIGLGHPF